MTVGAVSNYGTNTGLGIGSLNYSQCYNDPYFIQAFQSPNYYQMQAQNTQQAGAQAQTATTPTTGVNPSFKGAAEEIAGKSEKKNNSAAKWVLGTFAAVGTALLAWKCHGKGVGEKWYSKIWDGAKQYWDIGIDKIGKLKFNKTELDEVLDDAWIAGAHST